MSDNVAEGEKVACPPFVALVFQKGVDQKLKVPEALNPFVRQVLVLVKAQKFLEIAIAGFNMPPYLVVAQNRNQIQAQVGTK